MDIKLRVLRKKNNKKKPKRILVTPLFPSRFMNQPRFNYSSASDLEPIRSTDGSAGFDLRADLPEGEEVILNPGESYVFSTGVILEPLDPNWAAYVYSRSGISTKKQVMLLNGVAVIDPDYRGVVHAPLINMGKEPICIRRGDRIVQCCFFPYGIPRLTKVDPACMSKTHRGEGKFGHTGVC